MTSKTITWQVWEDIILHPYNYDFKGLTKAQVEKLVADGKASWVLASGGVQTFQWICQVCNTLHDDLQKHNEEIGDAEHSILLVHNS